MNLKLFIIKKQFLVLLTDTVVSLARIPETARSIVRPIIAFKPRADCHNELGELSDAIDLLADRLGQTSIREKAFTEDLSRHSAQLRQLNNDLMSLEESARESISSEVKTAIIRSIGTDVSKIRSLVHQGNYLYQNDLGELRIFLEHAINNIKTSVYKIVPPLLGDVNAAIDFLLKGLNEKNATDFIITHSAGRQVKLTKTIKQTCYRAIKTIISKILEHSDSPDVEVEIFAESDQLIVGIRSDGAGIGTQEIKNMPSCGSDPRSLPKQIEALGGSMLTRPDGGNRIIICLKMPIPSDG